MRLHLYKRGVVWWVRGSEGGVKVRRSTKQTSEAKAKRLRDRWERELLDPDHHRAHQATVESAGKRWLREIGSAMNPETVRFYTVKALHVERLLGSVRLLGITHEKVLGYIERREAEGAHPHTIHRELTTLRLILKSAKRAREFFQDPKDVIPRYQTKYVPRTDWVTAETIWACISDLPPHRGAAVAWAIATAADFSVIHTARRSDVTETSVLVRGTKTGSRMRHVPRIAVMAPFLRHALAYGAEGDELFGEWGSMSRDVRAACRRMGVPEFTARTLRRSAATWLVKAGVPYDIAAKFLGHGSTAMLTRVYGQLAPVDAARLIDERMGAE